MEGREIIRELDKIQTCPGEQHLSKLRELAETLHITPYRDRDNHADYFIERITLKAQTQMMTDALNIAKWSCIFAAVAAFWAAITVIVTCWL